MSAKDEIVPILKKLRLSGFLATLDLRVKEAVDEDLSHGEFLFRLLSDEVGRRDGKQLDVRLRRASFEGQNRLVGGRVSKEDSGGHRIQIPSSLRGRPWSQRARGVW